MSHRIALGLLLLLIAVGACEGLSGATRRSTAGVCNSDRDCLYGLVCRGLDGGSGGERACVKERYSRCRTGRDCYPGRVCNDGWCEVQCVVDAECAQFLPDGGELDGGKVAAEDLKCIVGECRTGSAERQCLTANDCPAEQDCLGGRCATRIGERCLNDFDCAPGQRCISETCR